MNWNPFKKKPAPVAVMSDVETALLKSLDENPDQWTFVEQRTPENEPKLVGVNRKLGITVQSCESSGYKETECGMIGYRIVVSAWSGKLNHSEAFALKWHSAADALHTARVKAEDDRAATATLNEIRKALKVV